MNRPLTSNKLALALSTILGLFIPGGSLLFANKPKQAFLVPVMGLLWIFIISLSRLVITPEGFVALFSGLLMLHAVSYVAGVMICIRQDCSSQIGKTLGLSALLLVLTMGIVVSCYVYKDKRLGFAFYHIPSESMTPTLKEGDLVLADTYAIGHSDIAMNDIVILKNQHTAPLTIIKRVTAIGPDTIIWKNKYGKEKTTPLENGELFVSSDNYQYGTDSREYGPFKLDDIKAKAAFVIMNRSNRGRDKKRYLLTLTNHTP